MASDNRMRRTPQQIRGQRRVSKILDAAAEVFTEMGYEAATTNAIAIRANTSIGSLYQFFPNKRSILDALANRYRAQLHELLESIQDDKDISLQTAISGLIDRVAEFYTANPPFQPMFYASQSSKTLSMIADDMCSLLIERINKNCGTAVPTLEPDQCNFYATVIVFMMRALIPLSQAQNVPYRERIIPQLKRMVFSYLASLPEFRGQTFIFDDEAR
jgi:AcrR family transcriptional regulator